MAPTGHSVGTLRPPGLLHGRQSALESARPFGGRPLRHLLEADGRAEVVGEASDGAEAVRLAAELRPDVVVLDLRMPGMDGVTALPLIRDASPGTVVVALSALPVGPTTDRAVDLGATYVRKPDLRRVVNLVAALAPTPPTPPAPTRSKNKKNLGPAAA
jgi:CheY-like chemotaxis protein